MLIVLVTGGIDLFYLIENIFVTYSVCTYISVYKCIDTDDLVFPGKVLVQLSVGQQRLKKRMKICSQPSKLKSSKGGVC